MSPAVIGVHRQQVFFDHLCNLHLSCILVKSHVMNIKLEGMKTKYGVIACQFVSIVLLLLCFSCNPVKRVQGSYSTKLSSHGSFRTLLYLGTGSDSSFFYQFLGDRINEIGFGYYSVNARNITLRYYPSKFDTLWMEVREDTLWGPGTKYLKMDTIGIPIKAYDTTLVEPRPAKFYYKNGRLYRLNPQGNPYRRNPLRKFRPAKDIA